MKKQTTIPHLKNRQRMIVEITEDSVMYKIGERHEVGCYIAFDYIGHGPHFEKGRDRNGDGIRVEHCRIVEVLKKKRTPVKSIGYKKWNLPA